MVFSSLIFLYGFLPLSLLAYALCRGNWQAQNTVLLIFSLILYAWGEPKYVLVLMAMAFVAWLCAGQVAKTDGTAKKLRLAAAAVIVLALIGYFKYAGLICGIFGPVPEFVQKIALPIGISFYTFQLLTYVVDVYRGEAQPQKSYWNVLLYAALFHQCIAGPIVRYKTIEGELFSGEPRQPELAAGVSRFCGGLAKKVLLANAIGALWDAQLASQSAGELTVIGGWLGLFAFGFQIYFEFSGYSDMAIGLGQIFGFRFNENFDYPYLSASVTEFWRRWHMSLTSWFREYLYIPLGGNRGGTVKTLRNILIVWFCTGFWHGASWNFILWGLYFAGWLILEKYVMRSVLEKTPAWVKHFYTLIVVFVGWGIFAMEDLSVCGAYLANCFGGAPLWSALDGYRLRSYAVTFLVLILASTTLGKTVWRRLPEKLQKVLTPVLMALSLVVCTAYLVDGSYNPFLYFRF